MRYYLTSIVFT